MRHFRLVLGWLLIALGALAVIAFLLFSLGGKASGGDGVIVLVGMVSLIAGGWLRRGKLD